jgi:LacI family transcriptional regulator
MRNKKPTIQDIALLAGVGPGTVSRVLNDHPNVSAKTRAKVLGVIEKMEYRPSFAARHMRTQRSQLIGFISDEVATTPYAGHIILGAQEAAWQKGASCSWSMLGTVLKCSMK